MSEEAQTQRLLHELVERLDRSSPASTSTTSTGDGHHHPDEELHMQFKSLLARLRVQRGSEEPSTSSSSSCLRRDLLHVLDDVSSSLHGALGRHKHLLDEASSSALSLHSKSRTETEDLIRQVVMYGRKISFGSHPGWFVPGQYFGERRAWAPFAGDMAGALLHECAQEEAKEVKRQQEDKARRLRDKFQRLKVINHLSVYLSVGKCSLSYL